MSSTGTTLPANGEDLVTGFFELELNGNKTSKQSRIALDVKHAIDVLPQEVRQTRLSNQGTQRTKGACALNQHTTVPSVKGTSYHLQPTNLTA